MDKVTGFEIPVNSMERAGKFYKKAFGWKVNTKHEDYAHIEAVKMDKNWVPKEKGAINGGMVKREAREDSPMIVVSVGSIKKSLDKIKKAGGKIINDKEAAGEWGWWAIIEDPEGNMFELWEDKE